MPIPTKSGYAPVNGVEVFYQTFSSGKPLVLPRRADQVSGS